MVETAWSLGVWDKGELDEKSQINESLQEIFSNHLLKWEVLFIFTEMAAFPCFVPAPMYKKEGVPLLIIFDYNDQ